MEIHIYLSNGDCNRFVQDDPAEVQSILNQLQPAKFFSQPNLLLAGSQTLTGSSG